MSKHELCIAVAQFLKNNPLQDGGERFLAAKNRYTARLQAEIVEKQDKIDGLNELTYFDFKEAKKRGLKF